ncbi:hypothetical protein G0Q06_06020 [Puniceicoccales bacterium CK1056]|uniref:FecR protein domain-containing protein n=1 Tax=Oceanipulchritudo coccoides TaxID=2706888 RepID=A0A6B2LZ56_9BACT|nr:hypothetical protein [Oceanipulchritudo coccoides]NDV62001.1 hypothetical protein [Oceanipulchritudo coccoides]
MKTFIKPILFTLLAPFALQAANVAEVVYEEPDGALYTRGGIYNIEVGQELIEGDILQTNDSTVILSLCEGSLLTAYPGTEVQLALLGDGTVAVKLVRGEVLGDISDDCRLDVKTKVGTASITDGVFGVVQNLAGDQGWTMQVRNLDGEVDFIGDPKLDTSNMTVSLIEPNETINIPAGEEIIVRGIYYESTDIFALTQGGAALASMTSEDIQGLREAVSEMSSAVLPEPPTPTPPLIIEIPYEDIETASDKG